MAITHTLARRARVQLLELDQLSEELDRLRFDTDVSWQSDLVRVCALRPIWRSVLAERLAPLVAAGAAWAKSLGLSDPQLTQHHDLSLLASAVRRLELNVARAQLGVDLPVGEACQRAALIEWARDLANVVEEGFEYRGVGLRPASADLPLSVWEVAVGFSRSVSDEELVMMLAVHARARGLARRNLRSADIRTDCGDDARAVALLFAWAVASGNYRRLWPCIRRRLAELEADAEKIRLELARIVEEATESTREG